MNEEAATNGFRGMVEAKLEAISAQLTDMRQWTNKHETEEFQFHGRVEAQMLETARIMATSVEHRQDLARRIDHMELELRDLWTLSQTVRRDVTLLFGGLVVVNVIALPIAAWVLWKIVNHQ